MDNVSGVCREYFCGRATSDSVELLVDHLQNQINIWMGGHLDYVLESGDEGLRQEVRIIPDRGPKEVAYQIMYIIRYRPKLGAAPKSRGADR